MLSAGLSWHVWLSRDSSIAAISCTHIEARFRGACGKRDAKVVGQSNGAQPKVTTSIIFVLHTYLELEQRSELVKMAQVLTYGRMRYIDSRIRDANQTVAKWMNEAVAAGIDEVRCQTGYYTFEGSSLLLPALKKCAENNGVSRFVIGSNRGATLADHVRMLKDALVLPREHAAIGIAAFDTSLFHPKVYHFKFANGRQSAYIGSSNLTGPGLSGLNIEAGIILDTDDGDNDEVLAGIAQQIDQWLTGQQPGISLVSSQQDIDELTTSGILALQRIVLPADPGEGAEGAAVRGERNLTGARLKPLVKVRWAAERSNVVSSRVARFGGLSAPQTSQLQRATEASFHYPQGTHLGHLLSILYYFANGRDGSAFADDYIKLAGGFGAGRIAGYRRQVKYKILAAIEIGLLTDIRLAENPANFIPELTQDGQRLWDLFEPFINVADIQISANEDGTYSSETPHRAPFYNQLIASALPQSEDLRKLYTKIFLNMPAAKQMLQYLYFEYRIASIPKADIYDGFFDFQPVLDFCDEMGIEPATEEAARHRCPFLLNILESCGVLTQTPRTINLQSLALSGDLIAADAGSVAASTTTIRTVIGEWNAHAPSLEPAEKASLRELFGTTFLTEAYHINEVFEIGT